MFAFKIRQPTLFISSKKKHITRQKKSSIETKHFTTSDFNKITCEVLNTKIIEKRLVDKYNILGFKDNSGFNKTIGTLAAKAELKGKPGKITKLHVFVSSYFCG